MSANVSFRDDAFMIASLAAHLSISLAFSNLQMIVEPGCDGKTNQHTFRQDAR